MDPVTCRSCGKRFPVEALTSEQCRALEDQHYHDEFVDELRMLERVKEFYGRYPDAEGQIRPDSVRARESDDPEIIEKICSLVPFDQIQLPPDQFPPEWTAEADDAEIVDYLKHRSFAIGPRMNFVSEGIAQRMGSVGLVACPDCRVGRLYVEADHWDEFANVVYPAVSCYWPAWHGLDDDGTLHIKSSGWAGGSHWTGERRVAPADPEYAFWRWFVVQKEHHRVVDDTEIPTIREKWRSATNPVE
jgi:hypothetical protein